MTIRNSEVFIAAREVEASLLGAILIEATRPGSTVTEETRTIVSPDDFLDFRFHDNQHARIYAAMLACKNPPNQIVVAKEMDNEGTLRKGDCVYLCRLVADCPCSLDYISYAQAVAEYSLKRQLQYHITRGNFDKTESLLRERKDRPRFTGGISP